MQNTRKGQLNKGMGKTKEKGTLLVTLKQESDKSIWKGFKSARREKRCGRHNRAVANRINKKSRRARKWLGVLDAVGIDKRKRAVTSLFVGKVVQGKNKLPIPNS